MRLNENQYIKTAFVVLENLSLLLPIVIFFQTIKYGYSS